MAVLINQMDLGYDIFREKRSNTIAILLQYPLVISAMIIQDIFPYVHIFPFKKNSFDCEGVENGGMMF